MGGDREEGEKDTYEDKTDYNETVQWIKEDERKENESISFKIISDIGGRGSSAKSSLTMDQHSHTHKICITEKKNMISKESNIG